MCRVRGYRHAEGIRIMAQGGGMSARHRDRGIGIDRRRALVGDNVMEVMDPPGRRMVEGDKGRSHDLRRRACGNELGVAHDQTDGQKKMLRRPAASTSKIRMYHSTRIIASWPTLGRRSP